MWVNLIILSLLDQLSICLILVILSLTLFLHHKHLVQKTLNMFAIDTVLWKIKHRASKQDTLDADYRNFLPLSKTDYSLYRVFWMIYWWHHNIYNRWHETLMMNLKWTQINQLRKEYIVIFSKIRLVWLLYNSSLSDRIEGFHVNCTWSLSKLTSALEIAMK